MRKIKIWSFILSAVLLISAVPCTALEAGAVDESSADVVQEEPQEEIADIVSVTAFRDEQEIQPYLQQTEQGDVFYIENGTVLKFEKTDLSPKFEYKFFYKDSESDSIFFPQTKCDSFIFKAVKKGEFFIKVSRCDIDSDLTEEKIFAVVVTDGETTFFDNALNVPDTITLNTGTSKAIAVSGNAYNFIGTDSTLLDIKKISDTLINISSKSAGTSRMCLITRDGTPRIVTVNVRDCIMRTSTNDIVRIGNSKYTSYTIADETVLKRKFFAPTGQVIVFSPAGSLPYTYEYFYQDDYGQEICIQPESYNGNFKFTPLEPRQYIISVVVRDKKKDYIKKEVFTIHATGKIIDTVKRIDTVELKKTKTVTFSENVRNIWKNNTNAHFAVSKRNVTFRGINEGTTEFIVVTENGRIYENYIKVSPKMTEPFRLDTDSVVMDVGQTASISFKQKGDDTSIKFRSLNTSVASVTSNGVIKALKAGEAYIVVSNRINAEKVKVTVDTSSIKLNTTSLTLFSNNKAVLKPIIDTGSKTAVYFYSSDTSVATVEQNGTVTAHNGGKAVITAKTANGKTAICTVNVTGIPNNVNISFKSVCPTVHVGETATVDINISDKRYAQYVSVSVSDKIKAAVSYKDGRCTVKGLSTGKVWLTASLPNGKQISTFFYSVGNYGSFRTNYALEKGIDVSCFNMNVNYQRLKEQGYTFIIIRAGFGNDISQKDEMFERHIQGAKKAGLGIGIYYFCYAGNVAQAKKEAQICSQIISKYRADIGYGVFYDYEEDSIRYATQRGYAVNKQTVTDILVSFCEEIERNGFVAGVYGNTNEGRLYMDMNRIKKYMFWYAAPGATTFAFDFDIWQYSFWLTSSAFSGEADGDKVYTTVFQKLK